VFSGEAANANFIVLDLTQPLVKPKIYRNQGEHANNYTSNVVVSQLML
jgi:hypothetical protein